MTKQLDAYQIPKAVRPLRELVEDLSNWYVRRSRRRFWKSEDDGDKAAAYATLHYTLCRIAQLLAPWAPFVSDKLWRELTDGMDEAESVHLSDWPKAEEVNSEVLNQMAQAREYITVGLAQRAEAKIKVRQPLAKAEVPKLDEAYRGIIAEELNVKEVVWGKEVKLDTKLTPELKAEGLMRDVVRHVQNARKEAGLEVDDRIVLTLETDSKDLAEAISAHADTIKAETLATELKTEGAAGGVPVRVDGQELYVSVVKAA